MKEILVNGLPTWSKPPASGHPMATEKIRLPQGLPCRYNAHGIEGYLTNVV